MKTYKNEHWGFEVGIPDEWSLSTGLLARLFGKNRNPTFNCGRGEAFNFEIGPLIPEPPPDHTEREFRLNAQDNGYAELEFGRIAVGGRDHVWARYRMGHGLWTKKYMIVLGGIEYAITASCTDRGTLAQREEVWDAIVSSIRLLAPIDDSARGMGETLAVADYEAKHPERYVVRQTRDVSPQRKDSDPLYAQAFEAVGQARYSEARDLLERCLRDNPDHRLAHKELAVVLRTLGDSRGALHHRKELKRLDPSDRTNRYNLAKILAELGSRGEAFREADELLAMEPNNPRFQDLVASLKR